jgi:uncharacterized protein (UPF0276 family)
MAPPDPSCPRYHGVGIGLRWEFLADLLARIESGRVSTSDIPFFEIAPENYMRRGGYIPESLEYVAAHFPIISHGLHMSIGSLAPYRDDYFAELAAFLRRFSLPWHSDHLCFSGIDGRSLHDLLPLPFTEGSALHAAARVREAQSRLEVPMAVENISWYLRLGASDLEEVDHVSLVLEQADCGMLLDVNNVYVNSQNHDFDAKSWIERIDMSRVWQLHVAGHEYRAADAMIIDTHGRDVIDPVYELLRFAVLRKGAVAVVLERDSNLVDLDTLLLERRKLQDVYDAALVERSEAGHAA